MKHLFLILALGLIGLGAFPQRIEVIDFQDDCFKDSLKIQIRMKRFELKKGGEKLSKIKYIKVLDSLRAKMTKELKLQDLKEAKKTSEMIACFYSSKRKMLGATGKQRESFDFIFQDCRSRYHGRVRHSSEKEYLISLYDFQIAVFSDSDNKIAAREAVLKLMRIHKEENFSVMSARLEEVEKRVEEVKEYVNMLLILYINSGVLRPYGQQDFKEVLSLLEPLLGPNYRDAVIAKFKKLIAKETGIFLQ